MACRREGRWRVYQGTTDSGFGIQGERLSRSARRAPLGLPYTKTLGCPYRWRALAFAGHFIKVLLPLVYVSKQCICTSVYFLVSLILVAPPGRKVSCGSSPSLFSSRTVSTRVKYWRKLNGGVMSTCLRPGTWLKGASPTRSKG